MKKKTPISHSSLLIPRSGFTLMELLVVIAIIGILATVVFISMSNHLARARASKAQAQLASVIPAMYSCWGNGGDVSKPSSNGDICSINTSYGKWPSSTNYSYTSSNAMCSGKACLKKDSWFVSLASSSDDKRVCCNSAISGCASSVKTNGDTCNTSSWTD